MTPGHNGALWAPASSIRDVAVGALALLAAAVGLGVAQATSVSSQTTQATDHPYVGM